MQAEGRRFEPGRLHHIRNLIFVRTFCVPWRDARSFDIVKRDEIDPETIGPAAQRVP